MVLGVSRVNLSEIGLLLVLLLTDQLVFLGCLDVWLRLHWCLLNRPTSPTGSYYSPIHHFAPSIHLLSAVTLV